MTPGALHSALCVSIVGAAEGERERGGMPEGGVGQAAQVVQASCRRSLLTNPALPTDGQGAAGRRDQGAAPEGQVPAGSAEPTDPAAGLPGKGDPAAQQGGCLWPGSLSRQNFPEPTCSDHSITSAPTLNSGGAAPGSGCWCWGPLCRLTVPPPLPFPPCTQSGQLWEEPVLTPPTPAPPHTPLDVLLPPALSRFSTAFPKSRSGHPVLCT